MKYDMSEKYIDEIEYLQDLLAIIRDRESDPTAITDYDSVYADILEYQDNDFDSFEDDNDLYDYVNYLKVLIIGAITRI